MAMMMIGIMMTMENGVGDDGGGSGYIKIDDDNAAADDDDDNDNDVDCGGMQKNIIVVKTVSERIKTANQLGLAIE